MNYFLENNKYVERASESAIHIEQLNLPSLMHKRKLSCTRELEFFYKLFFEKLQKTKNFEKKSDPSK